MSHIHTRLHTEKPNATKLKGELEASSIATALETLSWEAGTVTAVFEAELTGADLTEFDTICDNHNDLDDYKAIKIEAINARTGALIAGGSVTFDSVIFSLSPNAQMNATNIYFGQAAYDTAGMFPMRISTKADTDYSLTLANVDGYYFAIVAAKQAELDAGAVLRNLVHAAVDKAGVDAVADNR
jgi:hypothetical protein